ncbi:hypothetical protein ACQ4M3_01210 [Leptolyngbya sp. AN03gr2]|uniref:hypothetical protein n=1 Tax=unclassified Leptolyngbya TaxID=2650499 RepID=UPI003D31ECDC
MAIVQFLEHGLTARGLGQSAAGRARGFNINADTMHSYWQTRLNTIVHDHNRNPTEQTVEEMAQLAGEAKTTATSFRDYMNYKAELLRHTTSMVQTELRFYGTAAQQSAQLAKAQDQMVQQMGQAAYTANISGKYTQGIINGYQSGMSVANSVL